MTLGSLFDGVGGWLLAARHAGVTPVWASEIEAFPCEVTKRHFPEVLQLGDITKLNGANLPPVDIICAEYPSCTVSAMVKYINLAYTKKSARLLATTISKLWCAITFARMRQVPCSLITLIAGYTRLIRRGR